MAPFPRNRRMRREREEGRLWSRWSAFAATLLIAALFGLLSGPVRDQQPSRAVASAQKGSDAPHISKREPLRALSAADRRDAAGAHALNADGALVPRLVEIGFSDRAAAMAPNAGGVTVIAAYWPASLPRAPPTGA